MARPRKQSGNDRLMLDRLKSSGLPIRNPLQRPTARRWYRFQGLHLAGCYSKMEWRDWPPPPKPARERRGQPGGIPALGAPLARGTTIKETRRNDTRRRNGGTKYGLHLAVCQRLMEYKEAGRLSAEMDGHQKRSTCKRIWKQYRPHVEFWEQCGQSSYDQEIADDWELPPLPEK